MSTEADKPKWKRFEEFVANIQKQLAPNAVVRHNDKVAGISGAQRQIDVSVRMNVGQYELLVVVDCKNWKRAVDIKDVEEFAGLAEDVKANKGAIVCNAGFTEAAKKRAQDKGIDLFSAVDAESLDWPAYIALPALCDFRTLRSYQLCFNHSSPTPFAMPAGDARYIELYTKDGKLIDVVLNCLIKAWNSGQLPCVPGEHRDVSFLQQEALTKVDGVLYGPVQITVNILVEQRLLFGSWPLTKTQGFRNEITGHYTTASITTQMLNMEEVEKKWKRIRSIEELAVKPVLALIANDCIPLIQLQGKEKLVPG